MSLDSAELNELKFAIADRIYIQIENWHLYLGDAGLAEALALECNAHLEHGSSIATHKALAAIQVHLGASKIKLPLAQLIPSSQVLDLEEILDSYCR